ncbi:MAG TPA: MFS transporter [Gammaproteobacteria bacterium]|nr:MFS transporter [Gammaproteobacteria bacterium]
MASGQQQVHAVDERTVRRSVAAAALGNCLEWFDFGVYSYVAATIGAVFFPSHSTSASLLSSFAAFAVAFLVRPLGGFVFGPLGDRLGRSRILAITIIAMSCGTFGVGLIPGYDSIGVWAPILLVLARLVQGFSAGGEYGGAATFVVESATDERRGFLAAWLDFGTLAGYSLGALIVTGLTLALPHAAMVSWGWRVPFLLAGPLGLFGLYLRLRLEDSVAYRDLADAGRVTGAPLKEAVSANWRLILLCMGLVLILNVAYYDVLSYLPSYLQEQVHIGGTRSLLVLVAVMVGMMGLAPVLGHLSDSIGRKKVLLAACGGFIVFSVPAFWMLQTGITWLLVSGLAILGLLTVMLAGIMPSTLPAIFPTRNRYAGFAIAYNLSTSLFGGTAPFVIQYLVSVSGNDYMPAFYVMGAAAIALVPIAIMQESAGRPLHGSPPQRSRRYAAAEA